MTRMGLTIQRQQELLAATYTQDTFTRSDCDADPVVRVDVRVRKPQSRPTSDDDPQPPKGRPSRTHLGRHLDCYI